MSPLHFADALRAAARTASDTTATTMALDAAAAAATPPVQINTPPVRLIRDVHGRLRFAVDGPKGTYPAAAKAALEAGQAALGPWSGGARVLFRDEFSNPTAVFSSPDWHATRVPLAYNADDEPQDVRTVLLLDRQIVGQDWLRTSPAGAHGQAHRVVFFGLKGGVGRSTALSLTAWGLAREGRRVLLVDFDLESPGLSSLVLPAQRVPEFGLVDWLVEDAVGQGSALLPAMVADSPLGEGTTGGVRVATAMGRDERDYLPKLARAYADVAGPTGPRPLGARLRELLEQLEAQEQPDVVLIDSRAGLHDLAAVAITGLADSALLFATDGAQTWAGYRQLFTHWQRRPEVVSHVRERLQIVRALQPAKGRAESLRRFKQAAYQLFSGLYDTIPPADAAAPAAGAGAPDLFHPLETEEQAPHSPIQIGWSEQFQEFDPRLRPEDGGATPEEIEAIFGRLIKWVDERCQETTA
ncbi:MAG: hypothetical protein RIQ53_2941 [Pseudomonadota bacterium]|jgi:Mrp family chromosome partitioning ATPase